MLDIFNQLESEVRGYIRSFPTVFTKAKGVTLTNEEGDEFTDMLMGAGTLNYGHNNPVLKKALMEYLAADGVVHGLDMGTTAKAAFMDTFNQKILKPRGMEYKFQFTGPTGTNAVEAALKIARLATGRHNVITFTNGYHGMTLGALSVTGNSTARAGAALPVSTGVDRMPFDGYMGDGIDTTEYLDKVLSDASSGIDKPAAVILETVQGEGGVNVASFEWLRNLQAVCRKHGVLLIVDDIQVGCGRTGTFFSFEKAGIDPDIITLSKSLSGYGLPFALVLMKPELDNWLPGQHNGTFRGHNLAFVTAKAAIDEYWSDGRFTKEVTRKGLLVQGRMEKIVDDDDSNLVQTRGRGMMQALVFANGEMAGEVSAECFKRGVIIETCGPDDEVLKSLAALTITDEELNNALDVIEECTALVLEKYGAEEDLAAGAKK